MKIRSPEDVAPRRAPAQTASPVVGKLYRRLLAALITCILAVASLDGRAASEAAGSEGTIPKGAARDAAADETTTGNGTTSDAPSGEATLPESSAATAQACDVPPDIAPEQEPLPGLVQAFRAGPRPLTIVVLGSLTTGAHGQLMGVPGFPPRLQERLHAELAARNLDPPLNVESVGRTRAAAGDLTNLIKRQVLPLKPALVIWQVGRADARQGNSPHRFSQSLGEGLDILQKHGIASILADIQFHPQFEALYRTDDYRDYVRWVAGKRDLPLLRRYEMIEHWALSDAIDLDSGEVADQKAAYAFIQDCLAYQAVRMIVGGAGLPPLR